MTSYQKASSAQVKFGKRMLADAFNTKASFNAVGLRSDSKGYYIQAYTEAAVSRKDKAKLPKTFDGVRVKYKVLGKIRPQLA